MLGGTEKFTLKSCAGFVVWVLLWGGITKFGAGFEPDFVRVGKTT